MYSPHKPVLHIHLILRSKEKKPNPFWKKYVPILPLMNQLPVNEEEKNVQKSMVYKEYALTQPKVYYLKKDPALFCPPSFSHF